MSIISEALKKAQEKRTLDNQYKVKPVISKLAKNPKPGIFAKKEMPSKNIIIAGSVVLVIFFVMFLVFASLVARVQKNALVQTASPTLVEQAASTAKRAPVPATYGVAKKIPVITGIVDSLSGNPPRKLPLLNGIMYTATKPKAIIEGKTVSEGDIIKGYTIKHILPYKVTIVSEGRVYDLKLN